MIRSARVRGTARADDVRREARPAADRLPPAARRCCGPRPRRNRGDLLAALGRRDECAATCRSGRDAARHPDARRARCHPRSPHDRAGAPRAWLQASTRRSSRTSRDWLQPRRARLGSPGRSRRWSTSRGTRAGDAPSRVSERTCTSRRVMGAAMVRGYQGDDLSARDAIAATAKHFVAYGQPEGGRDYDTVDVSVHRLRNVYLEPFRAAVEAGAASVMASFNTVGGRADAREPRPPDRSAEERVGIRGRRRRRRGRRAQPAPARCRREPHGRGAHGVRSGPRRGDGWSAVRSRDHSRVDRSGPSGRRRRARARPQGSAGTVRESVRRRGRGDPRADG